MSIQEIINRFTNDFETEFPKLLQKAQEFESLKAQLTNKQEVIDMLKQELAKLKVAGSSTEEMCTISKSSLRTLLNRFEILNECDCDMYFSHYINEKGLDAEQYFKKLYPQEAALFDELRKLI